LRKLIKTLYLELNIDLDSDVLDSLINIFLNQALLKYDEKLICCDVNHCSDIIKAEFVHCDLILRK